MPLALPASKTLCTDKSRFELYSEQNRPISFYFQNNVHVSIPRQTVRNGFIHVMFCTLTILHILMSYIDSIIS